MLRNCLSVSVSVSVSVEVVVEGWSQRCCALMEFRAGKSEEVVHYVRRKTFEEAGSEASCSRNRVNGKVHQRRGRVSG